jgi:predicted component of type VI protein secretion system
MRVTIRILHGKLEDKKGHRRGLEVRVRGPRFVLGRAADCSMVCRSDSVSPYHCELRIEPLGVIVQDLSGRSGTFVNGQRVEGEGRLQHGDQLRIGRMEFEVTIEDAAPSGPETTGQEPIAAPAVPAGPGEKISELLSEADERERLRRLEHPELRQFHLDPHAAKEESPPAEPADAKGKKASKKEPGKLPPLPPERVTEDSTEAAQEALRKLFAPRRGGKR